jgi:hypothetical protein
MPEEAGEGKQDAARDDEPPGRCQSHHGSLTLLFEISLFMKADLFPEPVMLIGSGAFQQFYRSFRLPV